MWIWYFQIWNKNAFVKAKSWILFVFSLIDMNDIMEILKIIELMLTLVHIHK